MVDEPKTHSIIQNIDDAANQVSEADYLSQYAANFYEWKSGKVVKVSPVSLSHTLLTKYLLVLLETYLTRQKLGTVILAPFAMKLPNTQAWREPDLQIVLNTNAGNLRDTFMDGPADVCIEIVSKESIERDHGEKFAEYEQGGVQEYWIIDPIHREARFHRLDDNGLYAAQHSGDSGVYNTPLLPNLLIDVPTLWRNPLPNLDAIVAAVTAMLQ